MEMSAWVPVALEGGYDILKMVKQALKMNLIAAVRGLPLMNTTKKS